MQQEEKLTPFSLQSPSTVHSTSSCMHRGELSIPSITTELRLKVMARHLDRQGNEAVVLADVALEDV